MPISSTVIIPTFGEARFARWAIESVRRQTIKDMELCIICDGSPPDMASFFKDIAREDSRIKVFHFPKAERTGEPYRDVIIKKESCGRNIYYCSHDDLWFPDHIEELEKLLMQKPFGHSLHLSVGRRSVEEPKEGTFSGTIFYADIADPRFRERMLDDRFKQNYFGLSYGAHTREAYFQLKEGWATTPPGIWTDLYMWRKFIVQFAERCGTCKKITALAFPAPQRIGWSEQQRAEELKFYFHKIMEPGYTKKVNDIAFKNIPQLRSIE